ncbi:hypothetical protein [Sinorhizobium mexicanum]|uniref:Uncharacterized protein n=1 Tax=Sinorhizobium mexicanum TaxID=375549 RepID=A0A859QE22_9HYPH|nr:hypothetical protein [Sinorhizobium mexicanum]MBP1886536.1 hypothetical protein [Sinorhizobium mexicanum]QLL63893.1 hypothetical protein FKV68_20590 [Sinorhizobium mexicanum]
MNRHPNDIENILAAFAVEPNHDKETLDRYLTTYPDLRSDLLNLLLELDFDDASEIPLDLDSPVVAASWSRFSQITGEPLSAKRFTKDVATTIGVKTAVIMQLRDRAVIFASIPKRFLARLAQALGTGIEELTSYLNAPRVLAAGASYKADTKPNVTSQMELASVLAQCGHTPEEIAELVDEA